MQKAAAQGRGPCWGGGVGCASGAGGRRARAASLVAAAGAPRARRTAAAPIQELDLKRLYTDASYVPGRLVGPVEVQVPPGKARRVVAKRDVPIGSLLFVSEPVASLARSEPGRALLPPDLLAHLQGRALSNADRFKLSLLYDGTPASQQRQTSFKDFEPATAAAKAGKAKAAAKGFGSGGGGAAKQQQQQAAEGEQPSQQEAGQQRAGVDISEARLEAICSYNAWGSEVADIAAAPARGEVLDSFIGIWPEFALLNHSCVPNATATLVADRLVVRAASTIPKGAQVTTSYLDARGGVPLAERRRALQVAYGFKCACPRCKLEEGAPEELRAHLERLHALAQPGGPFDGLAEAAEAGDAARLSAMSAAAAPELAKLSELLAAAGAPEGSLDAVALRAGAAALLSQALRARLALAAAAGGGSGEGGCGGESGAEAGQEAAAGVEVQPSELLDHVEVLRLFQPGGAAVLATACDALNFTAAKHGPGSPQAQAALQLFLKMLLIKYGEVKERAVLERLVEFITRSAPRLAALGLDGGVAVAAAAPARAG